MKQDDSNKPLSKREKAKYPGLEKKYNLKLKQFYKEVDYIGGVYNDKGDQVIRSLNDNEKEFLNKFEEEYSNANFMHDFTAKEKKKITTLRAKYRKLKKEYKDTGKKTLLPRIDKVYLDILMISQDKLLVSCPEKQKEFYNDNNSRNRCLHNRLQTGFKLDPLDTEFYVNAAELTSLQNDLPEELYLKDLKFSQNLENSNNGDNESDDPF